MIEARGRRLLVRVAWGLTGLLLVGLVLRALIADVYHVTSSSMLPTLRAGEYVLVRFDSSLPRRGDLVVHERGGEAVVKRVVGLPGESIWIDPGGDVFADGERLSRLERRAPEVVVFDQTRLAIDEHFQLGSSDLQPWEPRGDTWELDARGIERGRAAGMMRLHQGVHDDWLDASGRLVRGLEHVGDVSITGRLRCLSPGGVLRMVLLEQGDSFELAIDLDDPPGARRVSLTRVGAQEPELMVEARASIDLDDWAAFRFENENNRIRFVLETPSPVRLGVSYDENRPHPRDELGEGLSIGERVQLGGEGCHLALRELVIRRDLSYTRRGDVGTHGPVQLGPDELFVLGDNSAQSRDSREFGPLATSEVFGRALWVVWPPSALRRVR